MLKLKLQNSLYCHKDKRRYEFKETQDGRYFVWISKYSSDHHKVNSYALNINKMTQEQIRDFYDKKESYEKEGHCVELLRSTYEYYLKREKESEKFLEPNKKHLKVVEYGNGKK